MWPPLRQWVKKSNAFGESSSCFLWEAWILNEAVLEVDCGYNEHAVGERWVADFEPLVLNQVDQVQDPGGIVGDCLEGLSDEGLWHCMSEAAQPPR